MSSAPFYRRSAVLLVVLSLTGCNLFRGSDPVAVPDPDQGMRDVSVAPGIDFGIPDGTFFGDVELPDTGDCVPESDLDACLANAVPCGPLNWTDNCGLPRAAMCDACDAESSTCDGEVGECSCLPGFVVADVTRCVDVDECAEATDDCPASQFCVNVPGTFECRDCPAGQMQLPDGTCVDADECADGSHNCDPSVTCTNLDPFFECGPCPAGSEDTNGDGTQCDDVDECADGVDNCDPLVSCTNDAPGFTCGSCPPGYGDTNGDGTQCDDVDECASGLDDCDANASCTNVPGMFTCACNAGWVGDGRTCMLALSPLVVGVYPVSFGLTSASSSQPLPAGITNAANVVPFATVRVSGASDNLEASLVDVWVDAGAGTIQAVRGNPVGNVDVEVVLVEFGAATVQSGTFAMLGTDSDTVAISAVDVSKAFVVFTSSVENLAGTDRNPVMAELELVANELRFNRRIALGSDLKGHWYAVEATGIEFSVEQLRIDIPDAAVCATASTSTDFARTLLLASGGSPSTQNGPLDDPSRGNISCGPAAGAVECCRGQPDLGENGVAATVFAVQFHAATNGAVEHGMGSIAAGDVADTVALATAVDEAWAMASLGASGLAGSSVAVADLPAATECSAFSTAELLPGGASIRVEIGAATTADIQFRYQAVSWPH